MNKETLKGQWKQLKGQVRKQWGKLTDDDLDQIHGDARFSPARFRSATAGPRTRHRKRWIGSLRRRRTSRSTGRGCEPPTIELHSIVPSRGDMPHAHRRHRRCTELDGRPGPERPGRRGHLGGPFAHALQRPSGRFSNPHRARAKSLDRPEG